MEAEPTRHWTVAAMNMPSQRTAQNESNTSGVDVNLEGSSTSSAGDIAEESRGNVVGTRCPRCHIRIPFGNGEEGEPEKVWVLQDSEYKIEKPRWSLSVE